MSSVSGVTLICKLNDQDEEGLLSLLNEWLETHGYPRAFQEISDDYGGSKYPQHATFGAGINHFGGNETLLAEYITVELKWDCPENVVLVIQPEEGETKVWRIKERRSDD